MMNATDFEKLVVARLENCGVVLVAKGEEYSRGGDRLWNFKAAARMRNCTPEQALMGMKAKHDVSVDDMVAGLATGKIPSKEAVAEKFGDSINYLLLLEGLIEERRKENAATKTVVREHWMPPPKDSLVVPSGFTLDVEEDC